tara:strand:+ start:19568 stop:19987 length:420 start_codon:yes stop_codon:yes gene_type:complete
MGLILDYRNTSELDYNELCEWWKYFRFPCPPLAVLPDNGRNGIMVFKDDINICSGFIYATSSPLLYHFEWIVSNPNVKNRELRKKALNYLIDKASEVIKKSGGTIIYTSLKNESLLERYKENGFVVGSTGCYEMIKILE